MIIDVYIYSTHSPTIYADPTTHMQYPIYAGEANLELIRKSQDIRQLFRAQATHM
jgi:hypothetical protein